MPRDEDLSMLETLAERMQLDDKQADNFINQGMQKLGYKPRMDWDEPDEGSGGEPTDMFGGGGQPRRRSREVPDGGRSGGRRRASGDWQYGD